MLHHLRFPECEHAFVGRGVAFAFPVVWSRDEHFGADFAHLVKVSLDEERLTFSWCGKLAFEPCALPCLGKVARDVPRDQVEPAFEPVEFVT